MNYRRLGKTNYKISEIGFGGWAIGGDVSGYSFSGYGHLNDDESLAAIQKALELGVTLFDTADLYGNGHSEAIIGEVISQWPKRDQIVIITKGGVNFYRPGELPEMDFSPYAIANAVQHSLMRLQIETIPAYLLMNPPSDLIISKPYIAETLVSLQRSGKISSFGVSAETVDDAEIILQSDFPMDVIEVTYSLFDQSAIHKVFEIARKKRIAVIAREPLANGLLTGKYSATSTFAPTDHRSGLMPEYLAAMTETASQLKTALETPNRSLTQAALRFVLDERGVTSTIVGAKTPAQVAENCAAVDLPRLTQDELLKIEHVFYP